MSQPLQKLTFNRQDFNASSKTPWAVDTETVLRGLSADRDQGLSNAEAKARLEADGPNQLRIEKKESSLLRFFAQFKNPVVAVLLVATVISIVLGEWIDASAISFIVLLNALIGCFQEAKAEAAAEALKKLSTPKARVLRDGSVREISATEIVRGDILVLEAGDYIPADSRVIVSSQLSADESILTGESLPVRKTTKEVPERAALGDRLNMLFADTAVSTGSAKTVVTATGMQTEIGKIAGLLESAHQIKTPLQTRLEQVSQKLLWFCLFVVCVVALMGLVRGEGWLDVLMSAISLAVAAIPEGLPTVVTLALALAVRRMVKRNAIVRHLPAVETLGSTDVICTDKTGTLTTGKMRVREVVLKGQRALETDELRGNKEASRITQACVLCSNASLTEDGAATGDPTEVALLYLAKELGANSSHLLKQFPRLAEWSFDSDRKRMSVAVQNDRICIISVKGAPESLLSLCRLSQKELAQAHEEMTLLSRLGRRILAVAEKRIDLQSAEELRRKSSEEIEKDLDYLGLVAIADPPRPESIEAIKACKEAGIRVVMITGDHPVTAEAIAIELGIIKKGEKSRVLSGESLETMDDERLKNTVSDISVYARVSPEHKLRIIRAWQSRGQTVAMTGDGVNDAPALKVASIGVAMGKGGTEVARQASSIILTDDNFATIVSAVEEGRAIYGNIKRTIQYLLSGNLAEILIMFGAAIASWPTPLAPIHLLWINLVTDGLPSLALAAEPVPGRGLKETRKPSSGSFLDYAFYREMGLVALVVTVMALAVYGYYLRVSDPVSARTHLFSFLVFAELFRSFASRSETRTFFQLGPRSNIYHLGAVAVPIAFQFLLHHFTFFQDIFKVRSVAWTECLVLLGLTLIPVTVIEMSKWIRHSSKEAK